MKKREILTKLRDAKIAHTKWILRAQLLIKGVDLDEDSIPVEYTSCKFGKWLYSEGQNLTAIPGAKDIIHNILAYHKNLHDTYFEIFEIYFKKKGFLAKLLNRRKKISPEEEAIAKQLYQKLETISQKLINELEELELKIIQTREDEINALMI